MKCFQEFLENLNFDSVYRKDLKNHEFLKDITFGIEIEFALLGKKPNDFTEQDFDFLFRNRVAYNVDNKQQCVEIFNELMKANRLNLVTKKDWWVNNLVKYWYGKFEVVFDLLNEPSVMDYSNKNIWSVTDDSYEQSFYYPIIELRSPVFTLNEMERFINILKRIVKFVKLNSDNIISTSKTGLHIHIGNKTFIQEKGSNRKSFGDIFSRLTSLQYIDEKDIKNHMDKYNRDDTFSKDIKYIQNEVVAKITENFKEKTQIVPISKLESVFGREKFIRNAGVNISSYSPTIEHRYWSSAILLETNGVKKIVDTIYYLAENLASNINKTQLKFKSFDGNSVVLTKLNKESVRIDILDQNEKRKIRRNSYPADTLR